MIFGSTSTISAGSAFGSPFGFILSTPYANLHYADKAFIFNTRTGVWTEFQAPTLTGKGVAQFSSGGEAPVTGQSYLSQWDDVVTGLEQMNDGRGATEASDTYNTTSTANAILSTVTVNFVTPALGERVTFQEAHVFWELNEIFSNLNPPNSVTFQWRYDWGVTAVETVVPTPLNGTYFTRVTVPREARNSTRLRLTIGHITADDAFGIEGIAMIYESEGAKETRK